MKRFLPLAGAIAVSLAVVGFLLGLEPSSQPGRESETGISRAERQPQAVADAAAYAELPTVRNSPNATWTSRLTDLTWKPPGTFDAVVRSPEMKSAAIADRAQTRAFDGAPPVIPHAVEQQSAASCLACHGDGKVIGGRIATKVSHAHFSSCTQCHVETVASGPFAQDVTTPTEFVGLERSGPGSRAMAGAPPTIPHHTFLREDCMSCHGLVARPGLRTTHPWLSNCTQCHAPSAELDQVAFEGVLR